MSSLQHAENDGVEVVQVDAKGRSPGDPNYRKPMSSELWRHVLLLRLLYFLQGISASTWGRFGTIYYLARDLSKFEIGIIEGLIPAVSMIASPFWGILADKLHSRKKIALVTQTCSVVILCLLAFPSIAQGFGHILAISMTMALFVSGGILDAHTLDVLGSDYFYDYGPIRMWSSISWGLGAMTMGFITDAFSVYAIFIVYAVLAFTNIFAVSRVVPERTHNEQLRSQAAPPPLSSLVRALLRPSMLFFLFEIALFGAGMAVVERLLFIYLKDDLGGNTTLCGLTVVVTVIFELPIFMYADRFLRVCGHHGLFIIAMASHTTRVFCYTLLTPATVYAVLPIEVTHGITYACMWTAAVEYAKHGVPPEWSSAAQTILAATLSSVGAGIGSVIGGYSMEEHGAVNLYTWAGYVGIGSIIMHLCYLVTTHYCGGDDIAAAVAHDIGASGGDEGGAGEASLDALGARSDAPDLSSEYLGAAARAAANARRGPALPKPSHGAALYGSRRGEHAYGDDSDDGAGICAGGDLPRAHPAATGTNGASGDVEMGPVRSSTKPGARMGGRPGAAAVDEAALTAKRGGSGLISSSSAAGGLSALSLTVSRSAAVAPSSRTAARTAAAGTAGPGATVYSPEAGADSTYVAGTLAQLLAQPPQEQQLHGDDLAKTGGATPEWSLTRTDADTTEAAATATLRGVHLDADSAADSFSRFPSVASSGGDSSSGGPNTGGGARAVRARHAGVAGAHGKPSRVGFAGFDDDQGVVDAAIARLP
jgi:PPP family 3-phenylpropionic acid transporter